MCDYNLSNFTESFIHIKIAFLMYFILEPIIEKCQNKSLLKFRDKLHNALRKIHLITQTTVKIFFFLFTQLS